QGQNAADDSRHQPQEGALQGYERQDIGLRPAVGPEHAELDEPLGRAHQHRVDDSNNPHDEGQLTVIMSSLSTCPIREPKFALTSFMLRASTPGLAFSIVAERASYPPGFLAST